MGTIAPQGIPSAIDNSFTRRYTQSMTMTTIKVSIETRDRLKASTAASGRSLGAQVDLLLDQWDRTQRIAGLQADLAENPPDDDYKEEAEWWASAGWID